MTQIINHIDRVAKKSGNLEFDNLGKKTWKNLEFDNLGKKKP